MQGRFFYVVIPPTLVTRIIKDDAGVPFLYGHGIHVFAFYDGDEFARTVAVFLAITYMTGSPKVDFLADYFVHYKIVRRDAFFF